MNRIASAACLLTLVWTTAARPDGPSAWPSVTLPVTEAAPLLDGALNDPCWSKAAELTRFHALKKARDDMPSATRCLLTRDAAWLYMGFVCSNAMMPHVVQQAVDHDGPVNLDEEVEIFFDPGTAGKVWYQYLLSWANVRKEQRNTKGGDQELGWNVPWRSATRRNDRGWTAEVAIPLFVLTTCGDMAKLRLNVTRARNTVILDMMQAPSGMERDFGTWSPLQNVHDTSSYGYLKGLEGVKAEVPLLPSIEWARVGGYDTDGSNACYTLTAGIRTHTLTGGTIDLAVRDTPKSGAAATTPIRLVLAGMSSAVVTARVAVAAMVQRDVTIELQGAQPGEIAQRYPVPDTSRLTVMGTPLADRNYYTDEELLRVRCEIGMPADALKGMTVSLRDQTGKDVAASSEVRPRTTVAVPLNGVAPGPHTLTVVLSDAAGRTLAEERVAFVKRDPNPGCEVKVDAFKRVLLKNGVPFFPVALYGLELDSTHEYYFKAMAAAGYNAVVRSYFVRPGPDWAREAYGKLVADTRPYLEMARKYNLMVMDWANNVHVMAATGKGHPQYGVNGQVGPDDVRRARQIFEEQLPDIKEVAAILKTHPNYLFYMNGDEPNLPIAEMRILGCEWYYGVKHELDPYHPAFLGYARQIPLGEKWMKYGEVAAYGLGYYPAWGSMYSVQNHVVLSLLDLKKRADAEGKVVMAVNSAIEAMDPWRSPRIKSPAEQRCQTYLTLIHGAKGLLYYCNTIILSQAMWDTLATLTREVSAMAPALIEEAVPQSIAYQPVALDLQAQKLPDVQVGVFRNPDGTFLLLAANSQWYPVETRIAIAGLKDPVRRLFADPAVAVKASAFGDTIERYGTRAYAFALKAEPDAPVRITVTAKALPDQGEPIKLLGPQIAAVKQRHNVMPNPSFEDRTVSGIPDFVQPHTYLAYPMVNLPDSAWGVYSNAPYHGQVALRMRTAKTDNGRTRQCRGMFGGFYPPTLKNPAPYVFSLYMRAKQKGDRVGIRALGTNATFSLTTDWKRYELSGVCGPTSESDRGGVQEYMIAPQGDADTEIWLDAMQMEAGTVATPFAIE